MKLTGAQEKIYTEMISFGWDFIENDGLDVIMARIEIINDGATEFKDVVRIEPDGRKWDVCGGRNG